MINCNDNNYNKWDKEVHDNKYRNSSYTFDDYRAPFQPPRLVNHNSYGHKRRSEHVYNHVSKYQRKEQKRHNENDDPIYNNLRDLPCSNQMTILTNGNPLEIIDYSLMHDNNYQTNQNDDIQVFDYSLESEPIIEQSANNILVNNTTSNNKDDRSNNIYTKSTDTSTNKKHWYLAPLEVPLFNFNWLQSSVSKINMRDPRLRRQ